MDTAGIELTLSLCQFLALAIRGKIFWLNIDISPSENPTDSLNLEKKVRLQIIRGSASSSEGITTAFIS